MTEENIKKLKSRLTEAEQEVAEHKAMVEELQEMVEKYRIQVENANDAIIILQNEKTTYRNPAYIKLIGFSVDDTIGQSFLDLVAPEDRELVRGYYYKRLQGEKVPDQYEVSLLTREGNRVAMEVKPCVIQYQGQPATMVVMRDISRRKQVEEERENLITELREALAEVKTLRGFLPICSHCSRIRDEDGGWQILEKYIQERSEAKFSHSLCPECIQEFYPDLDDEDIT